MSAARELARFIAKYDPKLAREATKILAATRRLVPGAIELVYDNYNALAIAFSATERVVIRSVSAKQRSRRSSD